jgi:type I restriction enzyme R subunit
MCTHLKGKASWFLPFNQGWNDGAGNPPNPHGLKTDYLWKRVLTPQGLTDILENYAQIVEKKDEKTGKKRKEQIFPRYHQLDVVRQLLADAKQHGAGKRYLIQHSAGSGKSNSIAWLAHQLIVLRRGDGLVFDSIIVVTDRLILDRQIRDTIKQYAQVIARCKIGGQARAMVVTSGIQRAIQYYAAIQDYLQERKSPYRAIVAFSGEHEYGGVKVTEASLNGFPSSHIVDEIQQDPYRFLVCAEKFQTGYDEPLLHTMYVDKILSGIKAVQTLSRLNRAHPQKHDVFVLDFMNDADTIQAAFADYYRTTILSEETDPNKLHDLKADLDGYQVYAEEQVDELAELYLGGADRDRLDPILDACVAVYKDLDEDGQVGFKGKAKAFTRTYNFLGSILPYTDVGWEKLSIFLTSLVPKLPAPVEEDLSRGILETVDMDSYRAEKQAAMRIALPDEDAEIEPVPTSGGGLKAEPEMDRLSNILKAFNDQFGNIPWADTDRVHRLITKEIPAQVAADTAYQNAQRHSDRQNARIEHDRALGRVMLGLLKDDTELFKQFSDNESFRRWLMDTVFALTYQQAACQTSEVSACTCQPFRRCENG